MHLFLRYLWPPDRETGFIIVMGIVMPVVYVQIGHPSFYREVVAPALGLIGSGWFETHGRIYQFFVAWVLFFAVPCTVWRFGLRKSIGDAGWRLGDFSFGVKLLTVAMLVAAALAYAAGRQGDFQREYPLAKEVAAVPGLFAAYEALYFFYYMGWESLFRGFMLFGLRKRFGDFGAIAMQTFPSVLLHIGKPYGELWASVLAGFLLGAWALRTGSVLYVLVFHYVLGVLTDLSCAWHAGLIGRG